MSETSQFIAEPKQDKEVTFRHLVNGLRELKSIGTSRSSSTPPFLPLAACAAESIPCWAPSPMPSMQSWSQPSPTNDGDAGSRGRMEMPPNMAVVEIKPHGRDLQPGHACR